MILCVSQVAVGIIEIVVEGLLLEVTVGLMCLTVE
jgi:hypothetical protein